MGRHGRLLTTPAPLFTTHLPSCVPLDRAHAGDLIIAMAKNLLGRREAMVVSRPTDSKRLAILDLASRGYRPKQIAGELDVSRQYVHVVLGRLLAGLLRDRPRAAA